MNLELTTILYFIIFWLVGSYLALICAVEWWGKPSSDPRNRSIGYILVGLASWLFVLQFLARKR